MEILVYSVIALICIIGATLYRRWAILFFGGVFTMAVGLGEHLALLFWPGLGAIVIALILVYLSRPKADDKITPSRRWK